MMREWIYAINRWRARLTFGGLVVAVVLGVLILAAQGLAKLFT
jgi:hypothetical protein